MDGGRILRHVAERSQQALDKYTLDDLLNLQDLTPEEQLQHLDSVLHIGISKIILLLQDLPFGFGSVETIRDVIKDYVQDIRDLCGCPPNDPARYQACVLGIFTRHRGMLGQIGQGLQDFQEGISECYQPVAGLGPVVCADVSDTVSAMRKIERTLDEFFTIRTTLRLLISHCLQLNPEDQNTTLGFDMQALLQQRSSLASAGSTSSAQEPEMLAATTHVGAVCLDTRPSVILLEAYRHVHFMCQRRFKTASKLVINGVPADEFLAEDVDGPGMDTHFPYVDVHLYFVFFEVLKTAMLTSIRSAAADGEPPDVHASLITGTSLASENERVVKITDFGEGINRNDIKRVWSYFPSVTKEPNAQLEGLERSAGGDGDRDGDHDRRHEPQSARGLGLAVSRVLVKYFGGEIDLHSIPRKGTDVYIYL